MGGATKLSNLMSLCEGHHVIVHEVGMILSRATDGSLTVRLPDRSLVPASPPKLDLHLAIWACFANARIAEERRQAELARQDQQLAA